VLDFDARAAAQRAALEAQLLALMDDPALGAVQHHLSGPADRNGSRLLGAMVADQAAAGGKRVRGLLPAVIVSACVGPVEAAVALGAAIELVHNGTLAHDDIQDGDRLRRGRPTLWTIHGQAQAINAGDALLVAPLAWLARCDRVPAACRGELVALIADAIVETIRGQVADLALRERDPIAIDDLVAVHLAKTAPLFGACLEGAAVLLCATASQRAAAQRAAAALGLAFQIRDDVIDALGTKGRGLAGADLREGKVTAPILLALAGADDGDAERLRADLRRAAAGGQLDDAVVASWIAWTAARGGISAATDWLARLLDEARTAALEAFGSCGGGAVVALCDRLAHLDG